MERDFVELAVEGGGAGRAGGGAVDEAAESLRARRSCHVWRGAVAVEVEVHRRRRRDWNNHFHLHDWIAQLSVGLIEK